MAAAAPAGRRRRLPLSAAGRGGDLRDDRLLHPVAHAHSDHRGLLLRGQVAALQVGRASTKRPGIFTRFQRGFEDRFERFRGGYRGVLERLAARRRLFASLYLLAALASLSLLVFVGQDFFPSIKSGEIDLHARFQSGIRIEELAKLGVLVEQQVRDLLPGHVTNTLIKGEVPSGGHHFPPLSGSL